MSKINLCQGDKQGQNVTKKSAAVRSREYRERKKMLLADSTFRKPLPKTNAQRKQEYRARKKKLLELLGEKKPPKSAPKTAAERAREYRARKKMLQGEKRPPKSPAERARDYRIRKKIFGTSNFKCQFENYSDDFRILEEIEAIYEGIESGSEMMGMETKEDLDNGLPLACILTEKEEDLIITDEGIITKTKEEANLANNGEGIISKGKEEENLAINGKVEQCFLWLEDRRDPRLLMEPSGTSQYNVLKDNMVEPKNSWDQYNFHAIKPQAKTTAERVREHRARKKAEQCCLWLENKKLQLFINSNDALQYNAFEHNMVHEQEKNHCEIKSQAKSTTERVRDYRARKKAKGTESYGSTETLGSETTNKRPASQGQLNIFETLSLLWLSKLRELEDTQKILAKDLIDQVLMIASFKKLTKNTCVVQKFS